MKMPSILHMTSRDDHRNLYKKIQTIDSFETLSLENFSSLLFSIPRDTGLMEYSILTDALTFVRIPVSQGSKNRMILHNALISLDKHKATELSPSEEFYREKLCTYLRPFCHITEGGRLVYFSEHFFKQIEITEDLISKFKAHIEFEKVSKALQEIKECLIQSLDSFKGELIKQLKTFHTSLYLEFILSLYDRELISGDRLNSGLKFVDSNLTMNEILSGLKDLMDEFPLNIPQYMLHYIKWQKPIQTEISVDVMKNAPQQDINTVMNEVLTFIKNNNTSKKVTIQLVAQ